VTKLLYIIPEALQIEERLSFMAARGPAAPAEFESLWVWKQGRYATATKCCF